MTQAEIPQPISNVPSRWGSFTTPQLFWLGLMALPPYLLLRFRLGPAALPALVPWLVLGLVLAFSRREGRRLDAWLGDWFLFQFQAHQLTHPGCLEAPRSPFHSVDPELAAPGWEGRAQ